MNVIAMNGGKVHRQASWTDEQVFPQCRTGGQNGNGTRYRKTESPVTCTRCQSYARPTLDTAECTDAKPCNLTTCYACARKLIDDLAIHMIDMGASESAVNNGFRYPAMNALASHVITVPAPPKPKAPKASTALTLDAAKSICARLRTLTTRQAGRGELSAYRVVDLRVIAKACGLGGISRYTKAELVLGLTEHLIGAQLNHQAIQDGVKA